MPRFVKSETWWKHLRTLVYDNGQFALLHVLLLLFEIEANSKLFNNMLSPIPIRRLALYFYFSFTARYFLSFYKSYVEFF